MRSLVQHLFQPPSRVPFYTKKPGKENQFPYNPLARKTFRCDSAFPNRSHGNRTGLWKEFKWEEEWGALFSFTGVVCLEIPDLLVSLVTVEGTQKDSGD